MPHTRTITVYRFDELSDKAKEKARDWWREGGIEGWEENTYTDAVQCAAILGIEIAPRNQRCVLIGPNPREWIDTSPAIYYSGFSSQGDGACFEGSYRYAKMAHKNIRQHAPRRTELHRIADGLFALQRANGYRLTAAMKHSGHYYHSGCMTVAVDDGEVCQTGWIVIEKDVTQLMRQFANWIYRQLETEYEYQSADAQVDEAIEANEYEFNEDGTRARIGK